MALLAASSSLAEHSLYFVVQECDFGGSTSKYPSDLKFMDLENSWYGEWEMGDCSLKFESSGISPLTPVHMSHFFIFVVILIH